VDSAGVVQTRYTYDAFGSVAVIGSPDENSCQFTGRENDGTGLYYYRTRYYHAGLQRFLSEDPIGLVGGLNLYRYAGNNPIRFNDQFGLCQIEVKFSPASGLPIGASHPQIVTTDPSGNQNFYEANAQYKTIGAASQAASNSLSGRAPSGSSPGFGRIEPNSDIYSPPATVPGDPSRRRHLEGNPSCEHPI